MELKNAVAVCLISLFSATLVLLIARTLDLQAASRLEVQLAQIVEELQALRKSGAVVGGAGGAAEADATENGLLVYYFHGNIRCPTCEAIESQSHDVVQSDFAAELNANRIAWKVLNYEAPTGLALAEKYGVHKAAVVLVQMQGGEVEDWKRLDKVWALVGDKPAFTEYVRDEIAGMLEAAPPQPPPAAKEAAPPIPVPGTDVPQIPLPGEGAPPLPVPQQDPPELPLPGPNPVRPLTPDP